ncbi:DUF3871 family protein [Tenacibaculum maritimum]|uniref:DUF3871 family protein n=1 Tax=Tenacibaculum maritimum TaxID=107401 RepID=UPI003875D7CE
MELVPVSKDLPILNKVPVDKGIINNSPYLLQVSNNPEQFQQNPFIEANTKEVSLSCLKNDCVIPVFAKDNEKTIAHQEFIDITNECVHSTFNRHQISKPEIRISHQIKGRIPEAIHKSAKDLLDHERTQYFERMVFIIRIPSITETINGNTLSLIVGGVRAYNRENLYSKKSFEKFQVFIGFQNMVCCNLCISTDGFSAEIKVSSYAELKAKILELLQSYKMEHHLKTMQNLTQYQLSEKQFAQLIGRAKLYQFLPKKEKLEIPQLLINDGQISIIAKDYYQDERFCKKEDGNINLWNIYNLFTSANKSSYIDSFLNRNVNTFDFTKSISKAINDGSYHWFLS